MTTTAWMATFNGEMIVSICADGKNRCIAAIKRQFSGVSWRKLKARSWGVVQVEIKAKKKQGAKIGYENVIVINIEDLKALAAIAPDRAITGNKRTILFNAFAWRSTPQGFYAWNEVCSGSAPYTKEMSHWVKGLLKYVEGK